MPIKPSVVELQALATELKLRASVDAQQLDAATTAVLLKAVSEYIELRADVRATVLDAATQYVLMKADAIVGEFIKFMGLQDTFAATDSANRFTTKSLAESQSVVDQMLRLLSKRLFEALAVSDVSRKTVAKPLSEQRVAADQHTKSFVRAAQNEILSKSDVARVASAKTLSDAAYEIEGPASGQTYADPTYFAESYVWDGGPIRSVGKALSDLVDVTDDFLGVANIDDDQVMWFTKSLIDNTLTSETMGRNFVRPGMTDAFAAADFAQRRPIKTFAESLGKSDASVRNTGKAASEAATTADAMVRRTDRALSETPLLPSDVARFSFSTNRLETASATDAALKSVGRVALESVGKSDALARNSGKRLTDSATSGDAGDLRMTDYADITYFAQNYVGTSASF